MFVKFLGSPSFYLKVINVEKFTIKGSRAQRRKLAKYLKGATSCFYGHGRGAVVDTWAPSSVLCPGTSSSQWYPRIVLDLTSSLTPF